MDVHVSLETLDWLVVVVYATVLIGIGFWVSFRRRGAEDLFLAGRSLSWPNVGLSIFGTNISPAMLIASCGIAYKSGMVAANFEWLAWWFMMLLAMLFVPHYLNTKISTMPEFMMRRFGQPTYRFLSWYALFTTIALWLGATLYTGGILFGQIMGWPVWLSVVVLTVIATSFTVAGGLAAVVITDAFQSILMIFGATVLTIIALAEVGSLDRLVYGVPPDYWKLIRPAADSQYPWPAVFLGYPVMGIWFWCTDQTVVQRVLGAKDLRHGQLGIVFAGYLKILPPFLFFLPGIICFVLHPKLASSDHAFITMVTTHWPVGMVGRVFAVLIAALISTLDSGLNSFSTIFTLDIYVKTLRPEATKKEIKWIGRAATLAAAGIGIVFTIAMGSASKDMFDLFQSVIGFIAPPMSAVFLIGVLWKRATSTAAISTLIVGSIVSLSVGACHIWDWPNAEFWPHFLLLSFYLFVGICAFMVVISLLTQKSPEEENLPTLKETYTNQGTQPGPVWTFWGLLAVIMLALYLVFN